MMLAMRHRSRRIVLALSAAIALVATAPRPLLANGQEFFAPAGEGKVTLVYFGKVKDQDGKPMEDVEFIVDVTDQSMFPFAFRPDAPGHFRSPDVGEIYKAAGHEFNPSVVTITAKKEGYKLVVRRVPLRKEGVYNLDFRMESLPAPAAQATTDGAGHSGAAAESGLPVWTWIIGVALLALVIGAVARRSSRRPSIGY